MAHLSFPIRKPVSCVWRMRNPSKNYISVVMKLQMMVVGWSCLRNCFFFAVLCISMYLRYCVLWYSLRNVVMADWEDCSAAGRTISRTCGVVLDFQTITYSTTQIQKSQRQPNPCELCYSALIASCLLEKKITYFSSLELWYLCVSIWRDWSNVWIHLSRFGEKTFDGLLRPEQGEIVFICM